MIKSVAGNVGLGVVLFGLGWGCTMSTADEAANENASPMVGMAIPTATFPSAPVVAPPMALTHATISCDLAQYFPDAPGAAGGWTTGSCNGSYSNYSWYPPTACSLDEMFSSFEGPNVEYLGMHCRAAMAGSYTRTSIYGRSQFVPSTSPPSRAMTARSDGPFPYNACTCNGLPPPYLRCGSYGYEYVICPYAQDDRRNIQLTQDFVANHSAELNQTVVGYCNPGTTAIGAVGSTSWGVVYRWDPKCPSCIGC